MGSRVTDATLGGALSGLGRAIYAAEDNKAKENQIKAQYERQKTLDDMQLLQQKIGEKRIDIEQRRQDDLELKGAMGVMDSMLLNKQDITPAQKESMMNYWKTKGEKFNFDIEPFFAPNKDETTGVVDSFSWDTGKSVQKGLDNRFEATELQAKQVTAAAKAVEAETNKLKFERGDSKKLATEFSKFAENNPNMTDEDIFKFMAAKQGRGIEIRTNPDGSTEILMGGQKGETPELQSTTKNNLEKDIINAFDQLSSIERMSENEMLEVFTLKGDVKNAWFSFKDYIDMDPLKLSPEEAKYQQQAAAFKNALESNFHIFRKDITGAQAAILELKKLKEDLINKELTKNQYIGLKNEYIKKSKTALRVKQFLLRKTDLSGNALGAEIDVIYARAKAGDDPTQSNEVVDGRAAELTKMFTEQFPKKNESQIVLMIADKMRQEGYEL